MSMVANSSADQSEGFLAAKLAAGSNITLTTVNPGGDETLRIDAAGGGGSDEKVKISAADTTAEYLYDKILVSGMIKQIVNAGGNERVGLSLPYQTGTVRTSGLDAISSFLIAGVGNDEGKIKAGSGISITPVLSATPGVGYQAIIAATGSALPAVVKTDISLQLNSMSGILNDASRFFQAVLIDDTERKRASVYFDLRGTRDAVNTVQFEINAGSAPLPMSLLGMSYSMTPTSMYIDPAPVANPGAARCMNAGRLRVDLFKDFSTVDWAGTTGLFVVIRGLVEYYYA